MTETAITPESYMAWIIETVKANGGAMNETDLDAGLSAAYTGHWNRTDLKPWRTSRHISKWKQNVASAKSALDRRGVVVRVGRGKRAIRVLLNEFQRDCVLDWAFRQRKKPTRSYKPLPQPKPRHVVPAVMEK